MNGNVFVFRPGGIQWLNVFTDWALLISAMSCVQGRKILEFDDSVVTPCEIPAGTWPMKDVMWAGFGPRRGVWRTVVAIQSGAEFTDLRMIGGQITIVNQAANPAPSPVSDFSNNRDHVQIGLRDDCGNTQLVNQFDVPLFNLGANNSALFLIQNCLFGMPLKLSIPPLNIPDPKPLIRHSGQHSVLSLNLLGQNQTGPNVALSEDNATVVFGAISSAAQVAFDQTSITSGGSYSFAPLGRIQRWVIPLPPEPPANTSQVFSTPNVLVRCNGHSDFTQHLPGIKTGFWVGGNSNVPLYTGGQEVVVAEVAGGTLLKVRPTAPDTIDLGGGPVHIGKHGSRTFVSDGVSNWITISIVP